MIADVYSPAARALIETFSPAAQVRIEEEFGQAWKRSLGAQAMAEHSRQVDSTTRVLQFLADGEEMTTTQLSSALGKANGATNCILMQMAKRGEIYCDTKSPRSRVWRLRREEDGDFTADDVPLTPGALRVLAELTDEPKPLLDLVAASGMRECTVRTAIDFLVNAKKAHKQRTIRNGRSHLTVWRAEE